MGAGCYGARESQPPLEGASSSESASLSGSNGDPNDSHVLAGDPLFLNEDTMSLPPEVLSALDECYQGAGYIWSYNRPYLITSAKLRSVQDGETLFLQGEQISDVYVVIEGDFVDMDRGSALEKGLGLQDSLVQSTYSVTAVAVSMSTVYQFPYKAFRYSPRAMAAAMCVLESAYLKSILIDRNYFENFEREELQQDTLIRTKGKQAEMIIVQDGVLIEEFKDKTTLRIEKGNWVTVGGEAETECRTQELSVVYRFPEDIVEKVFEGKEQTLLWKSELMRVLLLHPVLKDLEDEQHREIMQESKFIVSPRERIVASTAKSIGAKIFTVLRGALYWRGVKRAVAKAGEVFNFKVVTTSAYFTFKQDLLTAPHSVIVSSPRNVIYRYLSPKIRKRLMYEATLEVMESVQLFSGLPPRQLKNLANIVELRNFSNAEFIFHQGNSAQFLYVLLAGQVVMLINGKRTKLMVPYDYFGEAAIGQNTTYAASARALGHCICWALNIYQFGVSLEDVRQEFKRRLDTGVFRLTADQLLVRQILHNPITLRTILSTTKQSQSSYCVLIYAKSGPKDAVRGVDIEISIMKQLSSPFLPYLYAEMGTTVHRIVVLKFEAGIVLRNVLERHTGELNEEVLRVYVGCILLALAFMHSHEMLYLNLSPESVYIDLDGLPKLIQFHGSQQLLEVHRPSLHVTAYSAPEVSDPDGTLSVESDFWSLGLLLFECLAYAVKFPLQEISEKELRKALKSPNFSTRVTSSSISLLKHLVFERDEYDLTCETIMGHDWFGTVDWNGLKVRSSPVKLYCPSKEDLGMITKVSSDVDVTLAEYMREDLGDSEPIAITSSTSD